jgi:hypothetical protein
MIRCTYVRGPGFIALISTGHAPNRTVCEAECSIMLGAAHAMEQLAAWNPKSLTFEAQAHTGPQRLKKVLDGTAVFKDPRYRVVRRGNRKRSTR